MALAYVAYPPVESGQDMTMSSSTWKPPTRCGYRPPRAARLLGRVTPVRRSALIDAAGPTALVAEVVMSWLVPLLIFAIVVVAALAGLRWIRSEHMEALATTPVFGGLSDDRLRAILGSTHRVEFLPGRTIVREGERDKGFYVITKGSATVTAGGVERARLSSGAYFGEVAVIDGGPRTATVTAETRVTTLELTPAALRRLLDKEPSIANAMAERLSLLVPDSGASEARPVDRRSLEELCRRFREAQHPEWAQPEVPHRSAWRRLLGSSR